MQKTESGFVVIVTMLVMAGLISLGLSVANQSTEDAAESGSESDAVRVFNAAEAGIEEQLAVPLSDSGGIQERLGEFDGSDIRYSVTSQNKLETTLLNGGTATIDLPSSYTGTITVEWDSEAALLIALYSDDGAGTQTVQYIGVNESGDTGIDEFIQGTDEGSGKSSYQFTVPNDIKMIRIKSLFAGTNLVVDESFSDPQYYTVRSEATSQDGITRTIEVEKTIEVPPAILDYAVYSGGSITK